MATLQRSTAFRRQGSSGSVWDEKYCLVGDKVEHRELRPCQSARNIGVMDFSDPNAPVPTTCPRSLSTPAFNHASAKLAAGNLVQIPNQPKSGKRKLSFSTLFSANK